MKLHDPELDFNFVYSAENNSNRLERRSKAKGYKKKKISKTRNSRT